MVPLPSPGILKEQLTAGAGAASTGHFVERAERIASLVTRAPAQFPRCPAQFVHGLVLPSPFGVMGANMGSKFPVTL